MNASTLGITQVRWGQIESGEVFSHTHVSQVKDCYNDVEIDKANPTFWGLLLPHDGTHGRSKSSVTSTFQPPPSPRTTTSLCCSTLGRRAFSVTGPMAWNALPDDLREPLLSADIFRKGLKTHLFRNALVHVAH